MRSNKPVTYSSGRPRAYYGGEYEPSSMSPLELTP